MSVTRSQLGRGPAHVTFGGATLFTRDDLVPSHAPVWNPVSASLHGQIDKFKADLVIEIPLMLFGNWENLSVLFPSAVLNPTIGASLFSGSDSPLVIHARNQDRITYHNARLTKLAGLYLGVDAELFAAACVFTALLKDGANPEDAGAYFTRDTSAYSETSFAKTNFKKVRTTAAWSGKTGFTSFVSEKGFNVAWTLDAQPQVVDGLGTVDMYIGPGGLTGACKCVPIGPTSAQKDTAQALGSAHGALLSAGAANLAITGTVLSVTLNNAAMVESSSAFGITPLRIGEVAWETVRGFTTGQPTAVAAIS